MKTAVRNSRPVTIQMILDTLEVERREHCRAAGRLAQVIALVRAAANDERKLYEADQKSRRRA
jgi:hypothetical protein